MNNDAVGAVSSVKGDSLAFINKDAKDASSIDGVKQAHINSVIGPNYNVPEPGNSIFV